MKQLIVTFDANVYTLDDINEIKAKNNAVETAEADLDHCDIWTIPDLCNHINGGYDVFTEDWAIPAEVTEEEEEKWYK